MQNERLENDLLINFLLCHILRCDHSQTHQNCGLSNCCISLHSDETSGEWVEGVSLCYKEDQSRFTGKLLGRKNISFEPFGSTYSLRIIIVSS